ncbi:MAG: alpha-amylase family glycosyl hydrolase, partial [Phycisphaerales bacterium]|nr:alpha-amylase family glycosyl hydrolase [Phycisphaerales bacterium]
PGERNWGYDGVTLFAVQHSYGGLEGLRRLVDACHSRGIAVILDVVYNHLGPEGNYLGEFGPYFTDKYKTPWGSALNFDGPASDHVREFFIQNSLFWTRDCAVDGLRLDAVHAIVDHTASTFVEELAARNHTECNAKGRHTIIIAESNDNDPKLVRPASLGGYGLDGCWNDDYHHAIRAAITGDRRGYYSPFGDPTLIATALNNRYVFTGQHSSGYQRRHGAPALDIDHAHLVVFTQNHDQVGNRPMGDRLDHSAGRDGARLAAALVFLSPYTPMLWMGEEYAETAPFQYFVSHTDPGLVEAVRKGRAREFEGFEFEGNATVPDPQSEQTFRRSTLNWALRSDPHHAPMLAYYTELLRLRRALNIPAGAGEPTAQTHGSIVTLTYHGPQPITILANTASTDATASLPPSQSGLQLLLDSADKRWGGPRSTSLSIPGSISSITLNAKTALVLRAAKELA